MDIDLGALRSLEAEKDISMELAIKAIEDALLMAYHRTDGTPPHARVEIDRGSGHVTVWAAETGEDGTVLREFDDTPAGFGRIAATTARQVILQRLRDAEDELTFGEYAGREGDIVAGVIQQGSDPRAVLVDLGKLEAILPPTEQVPGERYVHGERLKCYVLHVRKGYRGPSVTLSRTHPNLVKKLFSLEVPEIAGGAVEIAAIAREAGHRSKIAVISRQPGVNAKGACIGPMQAPLALTPGWCEVTAIFVRWPASRAMATMSTAPEAISGTSSANSFFTRLGWVRDKVTDGPR